MAWAQSRNLELSKPSFFLTRRGKSDRADPLDQLRTRTSRWQTAPPASQHLLGQVPWVHIGFCLSLSLHITQKCEKVAALVHKLHALSRTTAYDPDVTVRIRLIQTTILPLLDYGSPLHALVTRHETHLINQTEKLIFLSLVGVVKGVPNHVTLAHEFGLVPWQIRWQKQALRFGLSTLANTRSSAHDLLRTLCIEVRSDSNLTNVQLTRSKSTSERRSLAVQADAKKHGAGTLLHPSDAACIADGRSSFAVSPLRVLARALDYPDLEVFVPYPLGPSSILRMPFTFRTERRLSNRTDTTQSIVNSCEAISSFTLMGRRRRLLPPRGWVQRPSCERITRKWNGEPLLDLTQPSGLSSKQNSLLSSSPSRPA